MDSGLNKTGVFCPVISLIIQQFRASCDKSAVKSFNETHVDGRWVYTDPTNSDGIREYEDALKLE